MQYTAPDARIVKRKELGVASEKIRLKKKKNAGQFHLDTPLTLEPHSFPPA
jgi:hypothetical protein